MADFNEFVHFPSKILLGVGVYQSSYIVQVVTAFGRSALLRKKKKGPYGNWWFPLPISNEGKPLVFVYRVVCVALCITHYILHMKKPCDLFLSGISFYFIFQMPFPKTT